MKKTVVDIHELQQMIPLLKGKFGAFLGKQLLRWLSIDKINKVYANSCHLRGAEFASRYLSDPLIDISYRIYGEKMLDTLPTGGFITVSNHPIGSLDGIMLIAIFARKRPDFKVMVNGMLGGVEALHDNFIFVEPDSEKKGGNLRNLNGVRLSLSHLKDGHPMGFFPAGGISSYNKEKKTICDMPWTFGIIRLIRKARVPVYPVYFDFYNSRFFYWLGRFSWKIRTLRIPAEAFNKRGRKVDVYLGDPISAEQINKLKDDKQLAGFLYRKTCEARTNFN